MAMNERQSLLQSERGAELIEFALVAPILILLISGIFDFGMLFRTYEAVTNAAREGARVAVLPNYKEPDVQARVDAYLAASGLTATHPAPTAVPEAVVTPAGTFSAVRVTVQYPYQFAVLGAVGAVFGGSFGTVPLQAVTVMRTETQAATP